MSVFGCNFCGERLYYHGEPEGDVLVEHYFCTLENWRSLEEENLPADCLENEHKEFFLLCVAVLEVRDVLVFR